MRDTSLDLDEHLAFAKEAPDHRLRSQLAEADRAHCELARVDSAAFNSYVLRHDVTHLPLIMAPCHMEWHKLAARHKRLLLWASIELGKSTQMSIGYTLFRLGQNPNLRVVIVSGTHDQAAKWTRQLKKYITESEALHRVFPNLRRGSKDAPWNEHTITVERTTSAKDASVQIYGVHGSVLGARIDLLILDDILNYENTKTQTQRDNLMAWYESTLGGRIVEGGQIICVGTAWHRDDMMHRFAKLPNWVAYRYPAINKLGEPSCPGQWSAERLAEKRQETSPLEFSRQLMCMARSDEDSRFKREWLDACLARGEGKAMKSSIMGLPLGMRTFTGVDLGMGHANSDWTVFFTILVYPNGDREVLEVVRGKWTGPEIVERIVDTHYRYHSEIIVESNAAQDFILQFTRNMSAVPVKPYTTTAKTHSNLGIEAMAVEFYNTKWIIPSKSGRATPEIEAWINEILYYDPQSHAGDALMACVTPGQNVTTRRGLVPIEQVVVGDEVLTHKAQWKRVTGTPSREWSGDAVVLKPRGGVGVMLTPTHPVWSANMRCRTEDRTNVLIPSGRTWDWRDAADLHAGPMKKGQVLLRPAAAWPDEAPDIDEGMAFLTGLWLAEGWCNHHQLCFALHQKETYLEELIRREARRLWGANVSTYTKPGHNGMTVTVHSKKATEYFRVFGKNKDKCLPWNWMALPVDLGLLIVRGWMMGDGSWTGLDNHRHRPKLRCNSVSKSLVYQMQQFLWRAGLLPSMSPAKQSGFFQGKPCVQQMQWRLDLTHSDTYSLIGDPLPEEQLRWGEVSWNPKDRTNCGSWAVDDGVAVKLAAVSRVAYSGLVYNLHVEDDHSFVVEGIAVHNCYFAREGARAEKPVIEFGRI